MKREILFRGKQEHHKVWVYGHYFTEVGRGIDGSDDTTIHFIKDKFGTHPVLPETVCQFTGLTDKNGVKIWEGSKVKGISNSPFSIGKLREYTVIWGIDHWHIEGTHFTLQELFNHCNDNIEVIGHIHDNPELINN